MMLNLQKLKIKYQFTSKVVNRSYAQIAHNRPLVVPRYDEAPRELSAVTRSLEETGRRKCIKMRQPYGSKKRIPGLLLMGKNDPIYLALNPAAIKTFLTYDHFLGKRYMLTVNENTTYEVIPQQIGVNPITRDPESVTFALWNGKAPEPVFSAEHRKKVRPWETAYLNEMRLKQDLKTAHDAMKEKMQSISGITVGADEELYTTYPTDLKKKRREQYPTMLDEMIPILEKTWKDDSAKVLELDKDERYPDDPHDEKDDDDDDQ